MSFVFLTIMAESVMSAECHNIIAQGSLTMYYNKNKPKWESLLTKY